MNIQRQYKDADIYMHMSFSIAIYSITVPVTKDQTEGENHDLESLSPYPALKAPKKIEYNNKLLGKRSRKKTKYLHALSQFFYNKILKRTKTQVNKPHQGI